MVHCVDTYTVARQMQQHCTMVNECIAYDIRVNDRVRKQICGTTVKDRGPSTNGKGQEFLQFHVFWS